MFLFLMLFTMIADGWVLRTVRVASVQLLRQKEADSISGSSHVSIPPTIIGQLLWPNHPKWYVSVNAHWLTGHDQLPLKDTWNVQAAFWSLGPKMVLCSSITYVQDQDERDFASWCWQRTLWICISRSEDFTVVQGIKMFLMMSDQEIWVWVWYWQLKQVIRNVVKLEHLIKINTNIFVDTCAQSAHWRFMSELRVLFFKY